MLFQVVIENGVKKIQALTADTGAGAPVGSLISMYKKSSPSGYLFCDGSTFDATKYPALYQYLGSNVLPDYRECVAVGAEQNTTDTIATHDVYTEGQFKDDQLQDHQHTANLNGYTLGGGSYNGVATGIGDGGVVINVKNARVGTTTHGKQKAVFIYIKATSGLTENQQENVLNTINEQRSYSTEEHFTGKYWYNGKKIYEKVITGLALSGVKTDLTNTGITITNLEEITNSISYRANPNGIISGNSYFVSEGGAILYLSQSGQAISKISFEYTKTTDN